jgi:hypothetical protein
MNSIYFKLNSSGIEHWAVVGCNHHLAKFERMSMFLIGALLIHYQAMIKELHTGIFLLYTQQQMPTV